MQRRNFIILSLLAAGTASVPFLNCSTQGSDLHKTLRLPQVLSQILDEESIKAIGKTYGFKHPGEYSAAALENLLKGDQIDVNASTKDIYASLDKRIRQDFESTNTIVLNGWVLSQTEARQCALLSLN